MASTGKKVKIKVLEGIVFIQATFNNTLITIADRYGNALCQSSAGACGFRGSRKSTPYAAQVATERVSDIAKEYGLKRVKVRVNGPGPGRESALRAVGSRFEIIDFEDTTRLPHNGTRRKKARRV